ncbi:hypothetical protein CBI38_14095 [Rhodococcus oxybenzonivorans]|uniref:SCP2 domain-containing protein n=1 Tax=Rhodococcus oxybenzonivorans TaxID=1990687 RepID=A0A2S2BVH6_9NOCA|nr:MULTISPECIES: hypothetical protein [Rhodococcus]AWK72528.1 hypothetical protein CBI38_14095 [Rhodococcus oxybenzonivorans]QTJ64386.1 hypothetical protein HYG77_01370 [Rhodococcus sp. ZPP]
MSLSFFSQEWCDAAKAVVNANEEMQRGFHDPASFTNRMALSTLDRDDLITHVEWKAGQIVSWTPAESYDEDLWLIVGAALPTWRECADGVSEGKKLLMAGRLKLVKGPLAAAISNADALNSFLRSWGQIDTDWNV